MLRAHAENCSMLIELKGISLMALTLGKRKIQPFLSFYHFLLAGLAGLQFLRWLVACHLWSSSRIPAQEASPSSQGSHISLAHEIPWYTTEGEVPDHCPCKALRHRPWSLNYCNSTALLGHLALLMCHGTSRACRVSSHKAGALIALAARQGDCPSISSSYCFKRSKSALRYKLHLLVHFSFRP